MAEATARGSLQVGTGRAAGPSIDAMTYDVPSAEAAGLSALPISPTPPDMRAWIALHGWDLRMPPSWSASLAPGTVEEGALVPQEIVDERTLAGWLSSPTEARAMRMQGAGAEPLIVFADIEEHTKDPSTGVTKRCDLTLRSASAPVATAEAKRPEVAGVADPALQQDAWKKAVSRGLPLFITCNFREVAVWVTGEGHNQQTPLIRHDLAPNLTHSSFAPHRRAEMAQNWQDFLDLLEPQLTSRLFKSRGRAQLPPQAADLRDVILLASREVASRVRAAVIDDDDFRMNVLDAFREQFGVEFALDPMANVDQFVEDSEQVAAIGCFVVATRLMLYSALASGTRTGGPAFNLDELDILRSTTDPQRVASDLASLYEHARRKTGDFEAQFSPSALDEIVFVDAVSETRDVGSRWGKVIDQIRGSDWQSPAEYVPGLYESLLGEEHRHVMGVHYTPPSVAEVISAYVVRDASDVILDPASGAGTFVAMCYSRKRALGSDHARALAETYAIELADFAASLTGLNLTLADSTAESAYPRVFRSDFFKTRPGGAGGLALPDVGPVPFPERIDGIVGNPPYVRFENRSQQERLEILRFLQDQYRKTGMPYPDFTGKADLWAFFIAGAHMYLAPGGRLGFVLSWNLLASDYGDAVLTFLGRYFLVDCIIDSRVERWFAAKQHTLILLARKIDDPPVALATGPNPHVPNDHLVRFVRLKQPIESLLDDQQPRGKKAEDMIDDVLAASADVGDDLRWDIRVFPQHDLTGRVVRPASGRDSG